MSCEITRRKFLKFLGFCTASFPLAGSVYSKEKSSRILPFQAIKPSFEDKVLLPHGFHYQILLKATKKFDKNHIFGTHNDFISYMPLRKSTPYDGLLFINHESLTPLFVTGWKKKNKRLLKDIEKEKLCVGASIVRVRFNNKTNKWDIVENDKHNYRLDANSKIPFSNNIIIDGAKFAQGTLANCSGGKTPWNTFLTCEENYDEFYGEYKIVNGKKEIFYDKPDIAWGRVEQKSPEHYGWVVEYDPKNKKAKKLVSLGRFSHEGALVVQAKDARAVVYMGDDKKFQFLYKFISHKPGSLDSGTLYVANIKSGKWLPLDIHQSPILKKRFKNQIEVLVNCREAGKLLGATPLDRPEGIQNIPQTHSLLIALTNNLKNNNFNGSLFRLDEDNSDFTSLTFKSSSFMLGGEKIGFSCPDNFTFDPKGNLWLCTDISGSKIGKSHWKSFGHNGLFYIPMSGQNAGQAFQVASCPRFAEFTGPCFAPDGKTLFLSVQHPGEKTKSLSKITSTWPDGAGKIPLSTVLAIRGQALDKLMS